MNQLSICPSCLHKNSCVLTAQKDKVWSCSEYDDTDHNQEVLQSAKPFEQENEPVLELA